MGKTIAIANQKGGVGKTTTAINLSAVYCKPRETGAFIDIDPQGNSTSGLGVERVGLKKSSYDVLVGGVSAVEAIRPTMMQTLDLMPANIDLVGAGGGACLPDGARNNLKTGPRGCEGPIRLYFLWTVRLPLG